MLVRATSCVPEYAMSKETKDTERRREEQERRRRREHQGKGKPRKNRTGSKDKR